MWELEVVEEVGSTSDVLTARAQAGGAEAALMARRQTGGRGRLGRAWLAPSGNLSLSVLLRPGALRWPGHWSILAGVALAEAVCTAADPAQVRLKWPNDVLLGGGKLAGILVEAEAGARPWVVIGMGVNLLAAPEGLDRALAAIGPGAPGPEPFARRVLAALAGWRERYEREGFEPVRAAWLGRGHEPGAPLTAGGVTGRFAGLAENGALLLDGQAGRLLLSSGELA